MQNAKLGTFGVILGSIALLLALVHFWAGPFAPQPTIESLVAEKATSISAAALDVLQGKETAVETFATKWDADKITQVSTAVLGGLAFILGILSFIFREPMRVSSSAVTLALSAITFQFIAMYAMALLVVILIVAVLYSFASA